MAGIQLDGPRRRMIDRGAPPDEIDKPKWLFDLTDRVGDLIDTALVEFRAWQEDGLWCCSVRPAMIEEHEFELCWDMTATADVSGVAECFDPGVSIEANAFEFRFGGKSAGHDVLLFIGFKPFDDAKPIARRRGQLLEYLRPEEVRDSVHKN
jgi:hypothetical protein